MLALLAASLDQRFEFPACVLLWGLLTRRARLVPLEPLDVGAAVLLVLVLGLAAHQVLRSPTRSLAGWGKFSPLPPGTLGPTASWAHLLWSGAWVALGLSAWELFGPAFVFVGGALLLFRAAAMRVRARSR